MKSTHIMPSTQESLSSLLTHLPLLRKLILEDVNLRDKEAVEVLKSLLDSQKKKGMPTLQEISFKDNYLGDESCEVLSSILLIKNIEIEKLNLAANNITMSGIKCLSDSIYRNCNLKCLDLSEIEIDSVHFLFESISNNLFLNSLVLCDCSLNSSLFDSLLKLFQSLNSITELNLNENMLGEELGSCLNNCFSSPFCKLNKLSLENCSLGYSGLGFMLSGFKNSYLRDLNISKNRLGDYGLEILSTFFSNPNFCLDCLDVSGNCISDTNVDTFLSSFFKYNPPLRKIDLCKNFFSPPKVELLSNSLQFLLKLYLDMGKSTISFVVEGVQEM